MSQKPIPGRLRKGPSSYSIPSVSRPRPVKSNSSTLESQDLRRRPSEPLEEGRRPETMDLPSVPGKSHNEHHSDGKDVVRNIIIGFADGLTVPFALTAGLSSLGSSRLVIIGGLAELFSGAISMGLGAYLADVTDRDRFHAERERERLEVLNKPDDERAEIYEILERYNITSEVSSLVLRDLERDHEMWVQFMMDFELKLEEPNVNKAWISAVTMGASYFLGGLIPMIPYFAMSNVTHALFVSIAITFVILLSFGFIKNYYTVRTKRSAVKGALETLVVGALAAGASYGIVRAIDSTQPARVSG